MLHQQVPLQFLPYFLEILGYSFDNDEEDFLEFVKQFKDFCFDTYESILTNNFNQFLYILTTQYKARNPDYFESLSAATEVLKKAFQLLKEKKMDSFDSQSIEKLILGDQEEFYEMSSRPKLVDAQQN